MAFNSRRDLDKTRIDNHPTALAWIDAFMQKGYRHPCSACGGYGIQVNRLEPDGFEPGEEEEFDREVNRVFRLLGANEAEIVSSQYYSIEPCEDCLGQGLVFLINQN